MTPHTSATVTGTGVVLPGASAPEAVLAGRPESATPVDPATLVGRKGLRYKDRATRLAYCAADAALRDAGLRVDGELTTGAETIGVIASSNLGNVDTVLRALDTIQDETVTGTSPMDLPNASSNVIASSIAIRFGLRGPNLMVCNGSTGGIDAMRWATTLLATRRAERVLVLGVEPETEQVRDLLCGEPVLDGAVALVVEDPHAAAARGARELARVGGAVRAGDLSRCLDRLSQLGDGAVPSAWHVPEPTVPAEVLADVPRHDLTSAWGHCSGALGVLQCVATIGWYSSGGRKPGPVFVTAGTAGGDAVAGLAVSPGAT